MDEILATPVERAKNILLRTDPPTDPTTDPTPDPAVSAALAQAWALVAIAERLEELAQVTREVNQNPPAMKAAPFASRATPVALVPGGSPAYPVTAPVLPKKRPPARVLPGP